MCRPDTEDWYYQWEPSPYAPDAEYDPEIECPDCDEIMEWNEREQKCYCPDCEEYHSLPENDNFDDYDDERYYY